MLLTDRNEAALNVLADELKAGKKHLAIFYGAAHLRGMERDLVRKMKFKPQGEEWITAWDIPAAKPIATQPAATQPK